MAYLNGKKVNNARFTNEEVVQNYVAAGVNPKDKQTPIRISTDSGFKAANKKILSINDEQCAINSVTWYNLPDGLDGNLIERILYYRGQGMFFYQESADKFMFLPFALGSKGIDVYGRFNNVTPLPFNGAVATEKESPWIKGLEFDVLYDIILDDEFLENPLGKCVLISDISKQISQTNISRRILNEPLIDYEAAILPYAKTNMLNGTGVSAMRVSSEDEYSNVAAASKAVDGAALRGEKYVPTIGTIEFQDLTGGSLTNVDQYLMAMQSVDNYRLQTHGVDSGGIFQKQAHMLQDENDMNASKSSFAMADRLYQRQRACDIINSLFGLGIWCEASEAAIGVDRNMDGDLYDNEDEMMEGNDDGLNDEAV